MTKQILKVLVECFQSKLADYLLHRFPIAIQKAQNNPPLSFAQLHEQKSLSKLEIVEFELVLVLHQNFLQLLLGYVFYHMV